MRIKYIGGELISSSFIPLGTLGTVQGNKIVWDNGVIGRYNSNKKYKQIVVVKSG